MAYQTRLPHRGEEVNYKYGKLAATRPYGLSDLGAYAVGKLPAPPKTVDYHSGVTLPIDGNDQYGDCVMAGTAHLIGAWDHEVTVTDHVPVGQEVVNEYFELTGGADQGLNESDVLHTWHTAGLFGDKIAGYAPVNYQSLISLSQATAFYGGTMFGIQVPASCQEQFAAGEPWTYEPDSPIEGGHCVIELGYDSLYRYWATWGGVTQVAYSFIDAYCDEAWAFIPRSFVEAKRGPTLDLASLQ